MRIAVSHRTDYRYSRSVYPEPHVLRLRPREHGAQRLLSYSLTVEPQPAGGAEILDQDGNSATEIWFDRQTSHLSILSSFEVETLRENAFDFVIPDAALLSLPLQYPSSVHGALQSSLAGSTPAASVAALAVEVAAASAHATLPFLSTLNTKLYERTRHVVRPEGGPLEPEQTLASGEAACRDLALVFIACCRSMGIAARFVSGYERDAASHHAAYMHAWAEVYLPGGGWRGYDPSRGLAVSSGHIAVAASATPELAAPIIGTLRGDAESHMDVSINMRITAS